MVLTDPTKRRPPNKSSWHRNKHKSLFPRRAEQVRFNTIKAAAERIRLGLPRAF